VFIEHGTRLLHVAGVTANPTGAWVSQQARNLAMELDERMDSLRFLIRDRDTKFTAAFDEVLRAGGVRIIKAPPQAPRANAICGRLVGTLRREVFDQMLIFNEKHPERPDQPISPGRLNTQVNDPNPIFERDREQRRPPHCITPAQCMQLKIRAVQDWPVTSSRGSRG
jgi:hypothetical protein